jgi:hypothetical protein
MTHRLTLPDFAGRWTVQRRIDDRHAGQQLRFEGEVQIGPEADHWRYQETGALILPNGTRLTADRAYLWRAQGDNIAVYFEDDRFFHAFAPEGKPEAAHWCDPDQYNARYDFSDWPNWRAEWTVTGPRKDYTMVSEFAKFLEI